MKKTLQARFNSQNQVNITMNQFKSHFEGNQALISYLGELGEFIVTSNELFKKIMATPQKTAANKALAREELVSIDLKLSNVLKVFANDQKDENLLSLLHTSEYTLSQRLRSQELLSYSENLLDSVVKNIESLIFYGVTEALVNELRDEIKDYSDSISEPRHLISERKTNNELLEENISNCSQLLIKKVDPLIELFKDDHEFYLAYKSARMIVDPAKRHRKDDEDDHPTDPE